MMVLPLDLPTLFSIFYRGVFSTWNRRCDMLYYRLSRKLEIGVFSRIVLLIPLRPHLQLNLWKWILAKLSLPTAYFLHGM